jgi:hypothetical protein
MKTKGFIIHRPLKNSKKKPRAYVGPVWDKAKARHKFKPIYENRQEALLIAFYLGQYSDAGFAVSAI